MPGLFHGTQAVTTSPATLPDRACRRVRVQALIGNPVSVWAGGATVAVNNGRELSPGDIEEFRVSNANRVYVVASTTGSTVAFSGEI